MAPLPDATMLEEQIGQWRSYLRRRQAIHTVDVAELEDHLREQVANLVQAGLATDEAFLVAVKRMGDLDALSREFAREHSERLWKQLVVLPSDSGTPPAAARTDAVVAFALAVGAALLVKLPAFFGVDPEKNPVFYVHNVPLFVLPLLAAYFAWKRRLDKTLIRGLAAAFVVAGVFANIYPWVPTGSTQSLSALHLPMALWFAVGIAYAGSRWRHVAGRMDFIRFSGELFIYYVLIALGGGVFTGFTLMIFEAIGINAERFVQLWLLPCGAAGAVLVGSWLVEAKQSVIENMAPVLTRLFTPLFAAMLVTFLATLLWTGRGIGIDRNVLIGFDLLLALVLGLLLYSISARDPGKAPGAFDVVQVVVVIAALLADAVALSAIAARISEFGLSPNRVAALGENVILLVNLGWSANLYVGFLRGKRSFADLERWQTDYLPVYPAWAALVVIVFPPLFGYL
ncbi:MAG: permease prefix domain 1-containing protein [Vicinamibacteria bacterium]|nr:permease prefix domain 1-containing protein [Vicinamibacteria bacterium]